MRASITSVEHEPQWIEVGTLNDVPRLGSRVVRTVQGDIALFRTADDQVFALRDACPHKGGPLSQGIVHGTRVTCPLHNWIIDLNDGITAAPDQGQAACYPVKVEHSVISISLRHA